MELADYIEYIKKFIEKRDIKISKTAIDALKSRRYLNEDLLAEMKKKEILENIKILLDDIFENYEKRAEKSARTIILRDIDVRPALKRKFCNLPPICRG